MARGALPCAMCWESCGARLGERFPDRLAPTRSGTFSAYGPCQAACKSPRSHRQPEAGTRETCRGYPRAARAMGAHADPQRRPYTGLGHGLRAGNGGAGFCMRQDTEPLQRLSRRVEGGGGKGKARRCSGKGRCWGGEGRGTAAAAVVVRVMVRETSPMPGCTPVPSEDRGPRQMLP